MKCANCGLDVNKPERSQSNTTIEEYDRFFCDNTCVRQWEQSHPKEANS